MVRFYKSIEGIGSASCENVLDKNSKFGLMIADLVSVGECF